MGVWGGSLQRGPGVELMLVVLHTCQSNVLAFVHMNVPAMWSSQSATLTRRRWEMHLPHSAPGSAHCRRRPP